MSADVLAQRKRIADLIDRFANGETYGWEWDDFVGGPQQDSLLADIRRKSLQIQSENPGGGTAWCNANGLQELKKLAKEIRNTMP